MRYLIKILSLLLFCNSALLGTVERSIISAMNEAIITELSGKINTEQHYALQNIAPHFHDRIRVMSFNLLLNYAESHLNSEDRWKNRKDRVVEYLQWAKPDIIGTQELQADQLEDILAVIGKNYSYYGIGIEDGAKAGDINAIFYRKERIELIHGQTFYFSETPNTVSKNPLPSGRKNTFTFCHFKDKKTQRECIGINTHLTFATAEERLYEASKLRDFLLQNDYQLPLFITGDFNTFPFRQELDLPFYDGDAVIRTIESAGVIDGYKTSLLGHFGPIASTNFCNKQKKPFCSEGDPGVILDHIFINDKICVLSHGIDFAKVNGHFPSDHFPVIIDMILP